MIKNEIIFTNIIISLTMPDNNNKRRKLYHSDANIDLELVRDTNKIDFVVEQFKQMGASENDLKIEYQKLMTNEEYYNKWANDISWIQKCPYESW